MVAVDRSKPLVRHVRLLPLFARREEHVLHRKNGHDVQNLLAIKSRHYFCRALEVLAENQQTCVQWVQREHRHLTAQRSQGTLRHTSQSTVPIVCPELPA